MAGRVVLLKSAIDSLPSYWFNTFLIPAMVNKKVEMIRRKFLWGEYKENGEATKKLHLLKWKKVCLPKDQGGLGLASLRVKNVSMLAKWWSRWFVERGRSWNVLIREKYSGQFGEDLQATIRGKDCSYVLRNIVSINNDNGFCQALSKCNFKWKIRNGCGAMFWEDIWLEETPLCQVFGRLYSISSLKHLSIRDFCRAWTNPNHTINNLWSRDLRRWELDEVMKINDIVNGVVFSHGEDVLVWCKTGKVYNCKEGRGYLVNSDSSQLISSVWNPLWRVKAPPMVLIFLWKFQNKILPTKALLVSRMINCISNSLCEWCKQIEETQDHLFWYCPWVKKVWLEIFKWWGLENKSHGFLISNIWSWHSVFGRSILKVCWNISIAATLWSIWLSRNQLIFKKKSINLDDLIYLIKLRVLKWSAAAGLCDDSLNPAWLLSPECTIMSRYKANLNSLLLGGFDLYCFTDGAFVNNPHGSANAGVGGFIKDKDGQVLYIFSGPSMVNCPLRAEIEAITFLLNQVASSHFKASKINLYTDC